MPGEGRQWIEQALAAAASCEPAVSIAVRAAALYGAGELAGCLGDYAQATVRIEESLILFRQLQDRRGIAVALLGLGRVARDLGDGVRAIPYLEESLRLFRDEEDVPGMAWALQALGIVARDQGDYARSAASFAEYLALSQEIHESAWHRLGAHGVRGWRTRSGRSHPGQRLLSEITDAVAANSQPLWNRMGALAPGRGSPRSRQQR